MSRIRLLLVPLALASVLIVSTRRTEVTASADPGSTGRESELSQGLVGHWSFDGCDGKTVKDRSAKGNDGVIESAELRREKDGTSLELDGFEGNVLIREKTPFELSHALTAALWVKAFERKDNAVLFGIPNATESWTTPVFGMYVADQKVVYGLWLGNGASKVLVESPGELPLDTWTFLAGVYDGQSARLYVNGVLVAEKPARGQIVPNGRPLMIGRGLGLKPLWRGRIGELRLYDRVLDAGAVHGLYEQTGSAYDLAGPEKKTFKDGTVIVETHGIRPDSDRPWRPQPTRLLELLEGYRPAADRAKLDPYGGWLDRPRERATGFFYVKTVNGRPWLIDPDGYRFFHVAMNAVAEPRDVGADFGSAQQWAQTVTAQLREAGFNGLGNWCSPRLNHVKSPLVWVLHKDFMFAFARQKKLTKPAAGTVGFVNGCMPVFHPEFPAFCERFAQDLAATAPDPHLLGIMTDNELQCSVSLLDRYLALDPNDADLRPSRDAAVAWLTARKGRVDTSRLTQRDRYEFIAFAFERYYRIVTAAVRKYDPNHLYLGSRINYSAGQFDNPWFWKALAPYHDVVSVNYYRGWGLEQAQFDQWAAWAGRPILLTEWYAKALDVPGLANRLGAGWLVRTQEDRGRYYQHFALSALELRNVVGWHWFKYLDDPAESRALDSAGGANKGMFDLHGRPYEPLLNRARAVNREVYPLIEFFDARNRGG